MQPSTNATLRDMATPARTVADAWRVRRAVEQAIARRMVRADPDLSLEAVAAELEISPRRLQRLLAQTGTSLRAVRLAVRMEQARALIETEELPSRVVAGRVGYRQPSGFAKAFRRYWGRNPSTYQTPPPEYLGDVTF